MQRILNAIARRELRADTLPELRAKLVRWQSWATRTGDSEALRFVRSIEEEIAAMERRAA